MSGTGHHTFPVTRVTLLEQLRDSEEQNRSQAFGTLAALYWMPVYKYLRLKWKKSAADAQDLTQAFFARALEKEFFRKYDPHKARFRTFLRTCLDAFASNDRKAQKALKRGGHAIHVDLDWNAAEKELSVLQNRETPESIFEKEWIRSVFRISLQQFRHQCENNGKFLHYLLLERYDIESEQEISYKQLAADFGLSVSQVTNGLAEARRQFRKIVLETLRMCTASKEEFRGKHVHC